MYMVKENSVFKLCYIRHTDILNLTGSDVAADPQYPLINHMDPLVMAELIIQPPVSHVWMLFMKLFYFFSKFLVYPVIFGFLPTQPFIVGSP